MADTIRPQTTILYSVQLHGIFATLNFDNRLLVAGVRSGSPDTRHRGAVLTGTKRHATEATGLRDGCRCTTMLRRRHQIESVPAPDKHRSQ